MLRSAVSALALALLAAGDADQDAMLAKIKFEDIADAISDTPPAISATTSDGQERLLQEGKVLYPPSILSPKAMSGSFLDGEDAEIMERDFPWSEYDYLDGDEKNARILQGFEAEFAARTGTQPPEWVGLEHALDDPENLRASLDLSLAYIKNYELDKAEILLGMFALPACRVRGLPWIAKALQDYATLKMKQNRQAEALLLLKEMESIVPPHPIMAHNLGLAYNSMEKHHLALKKFNEVVELKDGEMTYDDYWSIGVTLTHLGNYKKALPKLIKTLELASEDPKVDDVTLAKINDSIGSCLRNEAESMEDDPNERMVLIKEAEPFFREAVELYRRTIGEKQHLYGNACNHLAKNLIAQGREAEAEPLLYEAMWIEVLKNSIHPTPCLTMVMELLDIHEKGGLPKEEIPKYHDLLRVMLMHLYARGFAADGNGAVVMQVAARFLLLSEEELVLPALTLLRQAERLVKSEYRDGEAEDMDSDLAADVAWVEMTLHFEIQIAEATLAKKEEAGVLLEPAEWLFEGPWGMPTGADIAFGLAEGEAPRKSPGAARLAQILGFLKDSQKKTA